MALEVDLVAASGVVLATEEVVKAHLIKCRDRGVGRDMATDSNALALCAGHHHGGIPSQPPAIGALHGFIAGEVGLFVNTNGVDVRGVER